jgi:hypothetical protein
VIRPIDALLLSEFGIGTSDANIHGLPDRTLMQFEGSGIETAWVTEFTDEGAATGLKKLTDLLITFDVEAKFSANLFANRPRPPLLYRKTQAMIISARKQNNLGLSLLRGSQDATEDVITWKLYPLLRKNLKRTVEGSRYYCSWSQPFAPALGGVFGVPLR